MPTLFLSFSLLCAFVPLCEILFGSLSLFVLRRKTEYRLRRRAADVLHRFRHRNR